MRKSLMAAVAVLCLAGCATADEQPGSPVGQELTMHQIGDDKVYVSEFSSTPAAYDKVEDFVATAQTVIIGTVVAATDNAAEVEADPNAEGVAEGEGPDIFGRITFRVEKVLKGDAGLSELPVYYESGKRDGEDKNKRIAYTYEGLQRFQRPNATLKAPSEQQGKRFLVLAVANDRYPLQDKGFVLVGSIGIAEINPSGALSWPGPDGTSPVMSSGTPKKITLSDIEKAAG